jgi:hypothetical protein
VTAGSVVSLIIGIVKLANLLFGWLHDQQMIQEGQDRQIAIEIAALAARSTTIAQVSKAFEQASPSDVIAELQKNGELRD